MRRIAAFALVAAFATPAAARHWTPHTAAALLDSSFADEAACQSALDTARRHETHAKPVSGMNYTHLFEQGNCRSYRHDGTTEWRIRMEWPSRRTIPAKAATPPRTATP